MLRRWLWACAFVATVLVAALSHDAVVWAQGYGGVGFPSAAGRAMGQLAAAFCSLTGCTMTGQVVFSGVTTDISTATNEHLTLAPNGSGDVLVPDSNVIISGAAGQGFEVDVDSGGASVQLHTDATNNAASFMSWNTDKSLVVSNIGYFAASYGDADFRDKTLWYSYGKTMELMQYLDVAAGTAAFRFTDNATASEVLLMSIDGAGRVAPLVYGSQSNCSDGAGAAACSAAPAGSFVVDNGTTSTVVSTTAVTANSQILIQFDAGLGAKLGVTCNTNATNPYVTARTAGTSFTVQAADPAGTDPACFSYFIVN